MIFSPLTLDEMILKIMRPFDVYLISTRGGDQLLSQLCSQMSKPCSKILKYMASKA